MLTLKCFSKMVKRELIDARPSDAQKCCWRSWKVMKRDLVVASTRHHHAHLLKYYPRPLWVPSFVKSRMLRPLQTDFLLFQQIFFILVCIHTGNSRVPPWGLTSRPKPCGGNKRFLQCNFSFLNNIEGKITECWLVNEEGIFFLILLCEEGKITRSRLVLRLPSNSLFNREVFFLQQWHLVSR